MLIFIAWILLSFLVGLAGSSRTIGFFGSLFLSLLFSPLIGVIGVALSRRNDELPQKHSFKEFVPNEMEQRQYENLKWMRDKGVLTEAEFIKKRDELFNSNR